MRYFLLEYDRPNRCLVTEPREFADHAEALKARLHAEIDRLNPDIEVVVVGAESWEALEVTHSRYFGTVAPADELTSA